MRDWRQIARDALSNAVDRYLEGTDARLQAAAYEADRALNLACENYLETIGVPLPFPGAGYYPRLIESVIARVQHDLRDIDIFYLKYTFRIMRNATKDGTTPPAELVPRYLDLVARALASLDIDVSEIKQRLRKLDDAEEGAVDRRLAQGLKLVRVIVDARKATGHPYKAFLAHIDIIVDFIAGLESAQDQDLSAIQTAHRQAREQFGKLYEDLVLEVLESVRELVGSDLSNHQQEYLLNFLSYVKDLRERIKDQKREEHLKDRMTLAAYYVLNKWNGIVKGLREKSGREPTPLGLQVAFELAVRDRLKDLSRARTETLTALLDVLDQARVEEAMRDGVLTPREALQLINDHPLSEKQSFLREQIEREERLSREAQEKKQLS